MKLNYKDVTMQWLKNSCSNSHEVKIRDYYEYDSVKYFVDGKKVVLDYSLYEKKLLNGLKIFWVVNYICFQELMIQLEL